MMKERTELWILSRHQLQEPKYSLPSHTLESPSLQSLTKCFKASPTFACPSIPHIRALSDQTVLSVCITETATVEK